VTKEAAFLPPAYCLLIAMVFLSAHPGCFPILVFVATIRMGSVYSLPEYKRLTRVLEERGAQDRDFQQRLTRAAWLNRIELGFVVLGIIGIIVQALWSFLLHRLVSKKYR
jgi:hypothetical protein